MYIIEKFIQYINGKKYKSSALKYSPDNTQSIIENPAECEHFFMPLDSSKEFFACKYCGEIVSKKQLNDQMKPQ